MRSIASFFLVFECPIVVRNSNKGLKEQQLCNDLASACPKDFANDLQYAQIHKSDFVECSCTLLGMVPARIWDGVG